MKKLTRLAILIILFALFFCFLYSIIPTIASIFGGSFKEVAQCIEYGVFASICILIFLGYAFHECFDENYCQKN